MSSRTSLGRQCRRCGSDDWYTAHAPRPFHARCAQCVKARYDANPEKRTPEKRAQEAEWRAKNRKRINETARRWYKNTMRGAEYRWRRRGIQFTASDYDAMLKKQGGVCAICGNACKSGKRLAVDHDHLTLKVRGLLCNHCNMLAQDPDHLRDVLRYLGQSS